MVTRGSMNQSSLLARDVLHRDHQPGRRELAGRRRPTPTAPASPASSDRARRCRPSAALRRPEGEVGDRRRPAVLERLEDRLGELALHAPGAPPRSATVSKLQVVLVEHLLLDVRRRVLDAVELDRADHLQQRAQGDGVDLEHAVDGAECRTARPSPGTIGAVIGKLGDTAVSEPARARCASCSRCSPRLGVVDGRGAGHAAGWRAGSNSPNSMSPFAMRDHAGRQRHARPAAHLGVVGGQHEVAGGPAEEAGGGRRRSSGPRRSAPAPRRAPRTRLVAGVGQRTDQAAPGADVDVRRRRPRCGRARVAPWSSSVDAGQAGRRPPRRGRRRCRPPTAAPMCPISAAVTSVRSRSASTWSPTTGHDARGSRNGLPSARSSAESRRPLARSMVADQPAVEVVEREPGERLTSALEVGS